MPSTIRCDVSDRIMTITLDRPDRLNAFNASMRDELIEALDAADKDDNVRVVIVTGAGRGFCAGADLAAGGDTFDVAKRGEAFSGPWRDGGGRVALRVFESTKPVIGAINGPAVGVGCTMTLPMDIRIASDDARFGFVFARRGIVAEACSSWFLPRIVGISRALEWTLSGRIFPASEAREHGLVSEVVASDLLLERAREIARDIADNTSAVSVALIRQMMWRMLGADHPMEAHKIDSRGIAAMGQSADAREGVESFLQKRMPDFSMSARADMPDFYPWWSDRPFE